MLEPCDSELDPHESRFHRILFEAAPNAILVVDAAQRIVRTNRRTESLLGYTAQELIGAKLSILLPERLRAAHAFYAGSFLASPTERVMGGGRDLIVRHKDGRDIPVEIGLVPVPAEDHAYVIAILTDITERQRREAELRRSNEELEQFAYIAAHDLQEPLRMVANFTELLAQRYGDTLDDRAHRYIQFASDGARRMQKLVANLLEYSRVGSQGKPLVPVPAGDALDDALGAMRALIVETGARIEAGPLPTVLADETQLTQVLRNLIGNAIKFRGAAAPLIRVQATWLNGRWQFAVSDNGIGIDMRYSGRLFQMFQRLHEAGRYEGTGIGLAIAKRIVERHGGRIWLDSSPGTGTTVFFTLRGDAEATTA